MKASSVSSRLPRRLQRLAVLAGAAALCGALAVALAGCAGTSAGDTAAAGDSASASGGSGASANAPISVYSREDGSGTRGAFVELFGIEEKDANGDKVDMTTPAAAITNSTSVMMTSVAGDANAIGYISLGLAERHGEGAHHRRRRAHGREREERLLPGGPSRSTS